MRPRFSFALKFFVSLSCFLIMLGCGSDSGTGARGDQEVRVMSPANNTEVVAGETFRYELFLDNFSLVPPIDRRVVGESSLHRDHPPSAHTVVNEGEDSHEHFGAGEAEHSEDEESGHAHLDSEDGVIEINPAAREGHYHIYWDDAAGADPHITSWDYSGDYEVPANVSPGTHSLRFELRDNNHMIVGTPGSEAVLFLNVK